MHYKTAALDLHYVKNNNNTNDNKWKKTRQIIRFNPSFSESVKTNIGKTFLQLLSKHFPKNHKIYKKFNKNTVESSHSCMKNIGYIIPANNQIILNKIVQCYGCNCKVKSSCPLIDESLTPKFIYRTNISNDKNREKKLLLLQTHTLKKGTQTIRRTLNMKSMRIAQNRLNASGN